MLSLARILAPIDFSERSPGAARYAGRLACHFHAELTLLHVLDSIAYELSPHESTDPAIRRLSEGWRRRMEAFLTNFLPDEFQATTVGRVMLSGEPARKIIEFANSERASLIVIPTHGEGPFRRFVLGSVASKILHDAGCPILTGVHAADAFPTESHSLRNVLCGVDFCPHSAKTLEWACRFADAYQAQLTMVHITPSTEGSPGQYSDPEKHGREERQAHQHELVIEARQKVEAMRKSAGANAAILIDSNNDIPRAICQAASQLKADLVVVGRGSPVVTLDRLRTKVLSVIRQSPCPVLSV
jgi:nucleotide-binding universal stress UspA family protein